jgi:hypothetical protein
MNVFLQIANKLGFQKKKKFADVPVQLANKRGFKQKKNANDNGC